MADLIDFTAGAIETPGSPVVAAKLEEVVSLPVQASVLSTFDPLLGSAPASGSASATEAGLAMPKEVADAFAATAAGKPGLHEGGQEEWLPSGLSVDGQAALMKQIEESAKKMSLEGGEEGSRPTCKRIALSDLEISKGGA